MFVMVQLASDNPHVSIPLGIFIGLLASFIQSLGLTIQRKSHVLNQCLPPHSQRTEYRRPLWLLGFFIFIFSNIVGSLIQIASLPVVILAPLGAVSLLWNAFFARLILGDVFSLWMIFGTILIAGGALLIAIFGIVPESTHSLEDLLELFRRPAFVLYFSLLGMAVFTSLAVTHIGEYSWSRKLAKLLEIRCPPPTVTRCAVDCAHTSYPTVTTSDDPTLTERTPLLDRKNDPVPSSPSSKHNVDHLLPGALDRAPILLAISYASISGIISGMCLIFAKSGVELLLLTIGGHNQFRHWESWALVSGLIVFALLQLWYLHKALILANPTLVCPSAFCFYNLSSIVNGLIYFDQLHLIEPVHLCLVALGIVILLGGVWVVSIQSGGGGVDLGTWNEEQRTWNEEELDVADRDAGDLEQDAVPPLDLWHPESDFGSPARVPVSIHTTTFGNGASESELRSESCVVMPISPHISSPETGTSSCRTSRPRHRVQSFDLYGALRSPTSFQTRLSRRRTTVGSESWQGPTGSQGRNVSHPSVTFSPQLNDTVSTLGAGLQIGLSPISPGFIIVPRERRRRISVSGDGDAEQRMQSCERRTVSEGDAGAQLGSDRIPSVLHEVSNYERESRVEPPSESLGRRPSRARARWKWLQGMFRRRD